MHGGEIRIRINTKLYPAEPVGPRASHQSTFKIECGGVSWGIILPTRMHGEALTTYAWRCQEAALLQERLAQHARTFPFIPRAEPVLVESTDPNSTLFDSMNLNLVENLEKQTGNENLLEDLSHYPFRLWGTRYPWQGGEPVSAPADPGTPGLSLEEIGRLAHTVVKMFCYLKEQDGLYYLPLHAHVIVQAGRVVGFAGISHAITANSLLLDLRAFRRFTAGLYPDYAGSDLDPGSPNPGLLLEDEALTAFGSFIYNLALGTPARLADTDGLRKRLLQISRQASHGLPGGRLSQQGVSSPRRYATWNEVLNDLADPGLEPPPKVRIGIVLDYANVYTGLCGWDLDLRSLAATFNHYPSGRRVVFKVAAVVKTPSRTRRRIRSKLTNAGFKVRQVSSPTEAANQLDDQALIQHMLDWSHTVDEIVLITSDGDYAQTVRHLKKRGKQVRVVHFGPVSHRYEGLADEVIPGLARYRQFIQAGVRW